MWLGQTWFLLPHFKFLGVFLAACSVVEMQMKRPHGHKLLSFHSFICGLSLFLFFLSSHFHIPSFIWASAGWSDCFRSAVRLYISLNVTWWSDWRSPCCWQDRDMFLFLSVMSGWEIFFSFYLRMTNRFEETKKKAPRLQSVISNQTDSVCEFKALLVQTSINLRLTDDYRENNLPIIVSILWVPVLRYGWKYLCSEMYQVGTLFLHNST